MNLPPLSLYVHYPWCVQKCPYCDFNSHTLRRELPEAAYTDALLADLDEELGRAEGRPIVSVFIGGGTPSLIAPAHIERLLARLDGVLVADAEITLEANPGTLDSGHYAGYRDAGVNRLSVGVQSFDDKKLRALGRIHDAASARRALEAARSAGFERLNLDLMYALPDQTVDQAVEDVRIACSLDPGHISHYQLTLEPGTVFHKTPPPLPDSDTAYRMQRACVAAFADAGYRHYEISATARPGQRCRHNLNYWLYGDYLGIGAGAHGKLTTAGGITRRQKPRSPAHYLAAAPGSSALTPVDEDDRVFEFMLNALRLSHGFPVGLFEDRTGLAFEQATQSCQTAVAQGLLATSGEWYYPTQRGRRFLDDLQRLFLPVGSV